MKRRTHQASTSSPASSGRYRKAIVRIAGVRVGVLEEIDSGSQFSYDASWVAHKDAVPISLTMPVRAEPFTSKGLHPFFENLLPEGWLLEIATTKLKISKDDAFGLLLSLGADCIGAVEVIPGEPTEATR